MKKGSKYTSEQRKRMSEAQKKRMSNPEQRKKFIKHRTTSGMKGKKHSKESRKRMSEAMKGKTPWIKGKKHSPESLKKMGETHIGQIPWNKGKKGLQIGANKGKVFSREIRKKMSESKKGSSPWNKGIPLTQETKKKLSESLKGRKVWNKGKKIGFTPKYAFKKGHKTWNKGLLGYQAGEKSPMWKGGISFEPYTTEWTNALRKLVRERDNHTCQICGKKGNQVHHIDYIKANSVPENLITLCRSCHSKTNVRREKWKKYFHDKMKSK